MLRCTEHIRNVCFLAHVDHGKTTLSDSLISSVGIISERLSGKLRYLDNRDDEQRRMITIKSSSISLIYSPNASANKTVNARSLRSLPCIINLVDCPGHVDFSVEVSTAARLCDGALLIVDAVEGICPQTKAVLRQAWRESVRTVLVLNKIDKLILDLNMTPAEAYRRLRDLVDQVNALMFQLYSEYLNVNSDQDVVDVATSTKKEWFFCPSEGNVVFCSAIHRWCINLHEFVNHIIEKLHIPASKSDGVIKALWSDMYYCGKTKSLRPGKGRENPLFVQFVLDQVWKVYTSIMMSWNPQDIVKCISYSGATLTPRQTQLLNAQAVPSPEEREELLTTVMGSWIPISSGIIRMIVDCLHNPIQAAKKRLKRICPAIKDYHAYEEVISCQPTAPTVVHVAKFLGCDLSIMRLTGDTLHGDERAGEFVAFARIFSGSLVVGDRLYICGGSNSNMDISGDIPTQEQRKTISVKRIMVCMGADLLEVEKGWPGNIVALYLSQNDGTAEDTSGFSISNTGIRDNMGHVKEVMAWILSLGDPHRQKVDRMGDEYNNRGRFTRQGILCSVDRHLTLSSDPLFPGFPPLNLEFNNPIIRVSVEPQNVKHTNEFLMGLAFLYISDPAIELDVLKTGEYVLACCGEIHLERCVNDLSNLYAKIPIHVSKPRVSVREGIVNLLPTDTSTVAYSKALSNTVNFPPWQNNSNSLEEPTLPTEELGPDMKHVTPIKGMQGVFMTTAAQKRGTEYIVSPGGDTVLLVRALQMPQEVLNYLECNINDIKRAIYGGEAPARFTNASGGQRMTCYLDKLEKDILEKWNECNSHKAGQYDAGHLWAINTYRGSRTMLFYNDNVGIQVILPQSSPGDETMSSSPISKTNLVHPPPLHWRFRDTYKQEEVNTLECSKVVSTLISGFEIASQFGPCTEEPLRGVVFVIEGIYTNCSITAEFTPQSRKSYRNMADFRHGLQRSPSEKFREAVSEKSLLNMIPEESKIGTAEDICEGFYLSGTHFNTPMRILPNEQLLIDETVSLGSTEDRNETESQVSDVLTFQSSRRSGSAASVTGSLISCMRNVCRKAIMQRGRPRIYEVMLRLELQCDQSVLGKIYSVLQKRRTQIVSENVRNVTNTFVIEGLIPASESLGLAQDLRSKTSGGVIFHLQFSHWEMNTDDPFPEVSMTDEEFEDAGFNLTRMLQANVPRKIINYIRKMKVS